jgi:hypothetical protein
MTRLPIRLGPGECSDVETGARYFTAVAFPGPQEIEARENAMRGWAGAYLHEANLVDRCDDPFEDPCLNELVQLATAWCRAQIRTTRRRLRDRSAAARAVRPWVRQLLGEPRVVPGLKKFTQRQIALHLCDGDSERAANFQKRIWRPSRPVLHLAVAYDLTLCSWEDGRSAYELDLASASFIGELVELAARLQPRICADPRFGVNDQQILSLEWVP